MLPYERRWIRCETRPLLSTCGRRAFFYDAGATPGGGGRRRAGGRWSASTTDARRRARPSHPGPHEFQRLCERPRRGVEAVECARHGGHARAIRSRRSTPIPVGMNCKIRYRWLPPSPLRVHVRWHARPGVPGFDGALSTICNLSLFVVAADSRNLRCFAWPRSTVALAGRRIKPLQKQNTADRSHGHHPSLRRVKGPTTAQCRTLPSATAYNAPCRWPCFPGATPASKR